MTLRLSDDEIDDWRLEVMRTGAGLDPGDVVGRNAIEWSKRVLVTIDYFRDQAQIDSMAALEVLKEMAPR